MAEERKRFVLNKGERFTLKKSEGLNNLVVTLGWKGGADLDACAFLLGEDGVITDDADFVFYNSTNREKPFSREEFGNKKKWRELTHPMSADGSVLGAIDDQGDDDDDEGEASEEITVTLNKVDGKITEIVFCVTDYNEESTFGQVNSPYISITDKDSGQEICRYDLKEKFKDETAVVAGSLLCNEEGEWTFEAQGKGYTGGMQTLIDIYA